MAEFENSLKKECTQSTEDIVDTQLHRHSEEDDIYNIRDAYQENEVTFVTCFIDIYENEPYEHKTVEWRTQQFEYIANTGVKIVVYGCEKTTPLLEKCVAKYPNVKLLQMNTPYKETEIYKMCFREGLTYPERRNDKKDTSEYMALMHAKIEFVYDAIIKNVWNSTTFAWIDFSMAYIFSNKESALEKMRILSKLVYSDHFMAVPGCWPKISPNHTATVTNSIHWRFCGTFFIGSVSALLKFHAIYREKYPEFIRETKKIVWEVNVWAWLEANTEWKPIWYASDHNDRIVDIPIGQCCRI